MPVENLNPSLSPGTNPPEEISRLPVYLVVATAISGPFEGLVRPLATHLKKPDSQMRQRLTGTLPRLVRVTRERDEALETLSFLRQRGVTATACDARAVHASKDAVSLGRSTFADDGVVGHLPDGSVARLAYDDALCLLPAFQGRYLLYVFARSGGRPWVLWEKHHETSVPPRPSGQRVSDYPGMRHRRPDEDFSRRVHDLQRALPHAVYDERLLSMDLDRQCALLRAGDGSEKPWGSEESSDDSDSRVTRRTWPGPDPQELPSGLISPFLREETATAITTDVMAHLIALAYSRRYF